MILGTAAYMSPEQARGKADRREDRHLGIRPRVLRDADRASRLPGRGRLRHAGQRSQDQPELRAVPGSVPPRFARSSRLSRQGPEATGRSSLDRPVRFGAPGNAAARTESKSRQCFGADAGAPAADCFRRGPRLRQPCSLVLASWLAFGPTTVPGREPSHSETYAGRNVGVVCRGSERGGTELDGPLRGFVGRGRPGNERAQLWLGGLQTLEARMRLARRGRPRPSGTRRALCGVRGERRDSRRARSRGAVARTAMFPRSGGPGADDYSLSRNTGPLIKVSSTRGMPSPRVDAGGGRSLRHVANVPDGRHSCLALRVGGRRGSVYVGSLDSSKRTMVLRAHAANVLLSAGQRVVPSGNDANEAGVR